MPQFSHLDPNGNAAMVDVSHKIPSRRTAHARAIVRVNAAILAQLQDGDIRTAKGAVFQTAILAGVMGAKQTGFLIPLCHPLGLEDCQIRITLDDAQRIVIDCHAVLQGKTGVEMEALTGASIAALTVYDMCKAISHDMTIENIQLLAKTGGKNDFNKTT
jgi:cyclic pyranopterin monophosphate synthase